jgi:methyl-galactoside transport system substrate-binding protein
MKRTATLCLLILLLLPGPALARQPMIGLCLYSIKDTFIASLSNEIRDRMHGQAELDIVYAQSDQNLQNDQVLAMLKSGHDLLIVNPVDRTSAVYLIRLAKQYGVPIIFINREPLREDLDSYAGAYYVGIDPKQQGQLQGELAARYFGLHPEADRNGDGIIQLVLLRGEPGHQDAELRSLYAMRTLTDSGLKVEKLGEEVASWDKALGQEKLSVLLNSFGDRIECVLSNNDDMALGAIDALKAAGYFTPGKSIPVIGVDATAPALEMVAQGPLYGTVQNDAQAQARATVDLAMLLASNQAVTPDNYAFVMENKVVYIASKAISR